MLQPSCYDSIILIKKLPYLPDIVPSSSGAYNIYVEDFMLSISKVRYIWYGMTYSELRDILRQVGKCELSWRADYDLEMTTWYMI